MNINDIDKFKINDLIRFSLCLVIGLVSGSIIGNLLSDLPNVKFLLGFAGLLAIVFLLRAIKMIDKKIADLKKKLEELEHEQQQAEGCGQAANVKNKTTEEGIRY